VDAVDPTVRCSVCACSISDRSSVGGDGDLQIAQGPADVSGGQSPNWDRDLGVEYGDASASTSMPRIAYARLKGKITNWCFRPASRTSIPPLTCSFTDVRLHVADPATGRRPPETPACRIVG